MVQRKNQEKKRLVKFDISQYQYLYPTHERMFQIIMEDRPPLLGRINPTLSGRLTHSISSLQQVPA